MQFEQIVSQKVTNFFIKILKEQNAEISVLVSSLNKS